MGLIISKQIIQTNGGKFDFYSEYGVGTTTIFTFDIEILVTKRPAPETTREDSPKFGLRQQMTASQLPEEYETLVQLYNMNDEQGTFNDEQGDEIEITIEIRRPT